MVETKICLKCGSLSYIVTYSAWDEISLNDDGEAIVTEGDVGEFEEMYCPDCDNADYLVDFKIIADNPKEVVDKLYSVDGKERVKLFAKFVIEKKIRIDKYVRECLYHILRKYGYEKLSLLLKVTDEGDVTCNQKYV